MLFPQTILVCSFAPLFSRVLLADFPFVSVERICHLILQELKIYIGCVELIEVHVEIQVFDDVDCVA